MFFSAKSLALAVAAIGFVTASPVKLEKRSGDTLIGYRNVSPAQAARYIAAGTLTDDGNGGSTQLGPGIYTTYNLGGWPGPAENWNCAIWADSDALNRVTKAWIPEMWGSQKLWYASEDVLGVWIRYLNNSWDSAKTLRMSIISGKGYDDVQLLIPPGLLGGAGSMYFTVSCKDPDHQSELPTQDVNYDDWQNNIAGTRT